MAIKNDPAYAEAEMLLCTKRSRAFSAGFIATRETRIVVQALLAVSHAPPRQLRPQDALGSGATDAARAEPSQVLCCTLAGIAG